MTRSDGALGGGAPSDRSDDLADARIVVVDDQPANVALLERILRANGTGEVIGVTDPRRAVERCLEVDADLLLLDLHMPHVDGFGVMAELAEQLPDGHFLPTVVLTADVTPETRRKALAAGAMDFLTKPFDHVEVELRVRNLLRTKRLHDGLREERVELEVRVAQRTAELAQANQELLALDRMKRDFIAMASHEMRTPLTVVNGFVEVLTRRWDDLDAAAREQQMDAIGRNLSRLEHLIDNLVRAAALEAGTAGGRRDAPLIDVHAAIEAAVRDSQVDPAAVVLDCAPDLVVQTDGEMLNSVLSNLLSNARKYGAAPFHVTATADDAWVEVVVRDHGAGVSDDFVGRLFEKFSQASVGDRRTATGAGLGLWISRGVVRSHGGDITFEPADPGAVFRLRLPHRRGSETAASS